MKKLTVGDTSCLHQKEDVVVVRRRTLADIEVGEVVAVRFKDDFCLTPYKFYRLERKFFNDAWDEQSGYLTGKFRRVEQADGGKGGAVLLGALVALVVGAVGVMTALLGLSIVFGRALI